MTNSEMMKEFLTEQGFEVWEKGGKERFYLNNRDLFEVGLDPKKKKYFTGCKMHYDVQLDEWFYSNVTLEQAEQLEQLKFSLYEQAESLRLEDNVSTEVDGDDWDNIEI